MKKIWIYEKVKYVIILGFIKFYDRFVLNLKVLVFNFILDMMSLNLIDSKNHD